MEQTTVSVVIPVFNEQDSIQPLYEQLLSVREKDFPELEIIFVNDGSTDASEERITALAREDQKTKLITFSKNYGQTVALAAGIKHSQGAVVVTMDADLQNDPQDIRALVDHLEKGYDVVSGWRRERQDHYPSRVFPSVVANLLIKLVTGVRLHDFGCTLKAYRREFVEHLPLYGEMHRFIPAYCAWQGARISEIAVRHHSRLHGKSKYGLKRIFNVILDLIVVKFILSYLTKPIYLFGGIGIVSFLAGALVNAGVLVRRFSGGEWLSPLFFIGILLWSVTILCLLMGIMVEIIVRLYFEMRPDSLYKIRRCLNVR
jgi:glycosyltransferase involved in cell wall biosynthesis